MAANYLHGVETRQITSGARPVQVVKSSVIGLVGIAPSGTAQEPVLVLNERDAAQFGEPIPGFNIPKALAAIFAQGPATVIVVNTFDANTNTATVSLEAKTITGGKIKLDHAPIGDVEVFETDGTTPSDLVLGTDYTIDAYGNFTALSAAAAEDLDLKFTYKRLNAGTVTAAQIIGTYNGTTGVRTGMQAFDRVFNLFGFFTKVLIAPGYSQLAAVAAEMIQSANKSRGWALLDAPLGTTITGAIAGRGPAGTVGGFFTSSKRAILCYPWVKVYDAATDTNENQPYSQFLAGVISATHLTEGYWFSPSNREIIGVKGMERDIIGGINNAQSEANLLNEKGIMTLQVSYGTGFRTWGNRSASFPTSTAPDNFIPVQTVADVLHESLEYAMLPFLDKPLNNAILDAIVETVNQFMRTLIGRGALIDGECKYDPANNPTTQLAAGHAVFNINFMPPTPAERITFDSFIDISLLKKLNAAAV